MPVPFNRPSFTGRELEAMQDAIARGHISGNGWYSRRAEAILSDIHGGSPVLLTTSCTDALEMAALLIDVGPGDEVIVPSFTFVSTANAFALRGARLVFVDVRPDTLNIDPARVAAAITPRTRAIVVVHYAGVACDIDAILDLAGERITVVEDNAHGLFGSIHGRPLGTIAPLASLSFHETKNISCGEGGALVINDRSYASRAEVLREKGTDRKRFLRGEVDKYTWRDLGSSFAPSDLVAAFLVAQLEARETIQQARRAVWLRYQDELAEWAASRGVQLPVVPDGVEHAYHLFHLVMASGEERDSLIAHLRSASIQAVFHYVPLHLSEMGARFGGKAGQCPVTESVSERVVRLPLFMSMTEGEQRRVIDAIREF